MHIGVKALIGVGSLGAIGGAGVAIHHFSSGEIIENHFKNSNKTFLGSITSTDLPAILTAYESSQRIKPKDEKGEIIVKGKLAKWCEEAIKGKYYGDDDKTFKAVNSWCYIDTNSFADRLKSKQNKKVSDKQSTDKDWTEAWDKYKEGRNDAKLKITDTAKQSKLDGEDKTAGAAALKEWCDEKTKIKLYVDKAEEEFTRFDRWCPQVNAD